MYNRAKQLEQGYNVFLTQFPVDEGKWQAY
jgi:hypothetical protein